MSNESMVTPLRPGVDFQARSNPQKLKGSRREDPLNSIDDVPQWPFGEIPAGAIARLMNVGISTARRWRRKRRLPKPERMLAYLRTEGDLGFLDAAWRGWRVQNGTLISPDGVRPFTVTDLVFFPFTATRVQALEATIRKLTEERDRALESSREAVGALGVVSNLLAEYEKYLRLDDDARDAARTRYDESAGALG